MPCDACHVSRAIVTWVHEPTGQTLAFCGHHSDHLAIPLTRKGWAELHDERDTHPHPDLGPVTSDPATH